MKDFLPFVVVGVTSGALYGLAATGLVLTYKTSGVFNFAHGAVGAASAYLFYEIRDVRGLPWPVAVVVTVLVFAPLLGVVLELVGRRLSTTEPVARIVATIGVLLIIQGTVTRLYGASAIDFQTFLPKSTFRVVDVAVGYDQLATVIISLAGVGSLFVFFKRTRLGLEMRAVVDDPELLALTGASPVAVRRAAWIIGSCFAGLSGVLLAPNIGLDATLLTLLVVQAFGAAAVGRFESLGVTFVAGVAIGIGAAILTKYVPSYPSLAGLPSSLPFIVLFGVLVFSPAGRFRARTERRRMPRQIKVGRTGTVAIAVAGSVVVLLIPSLVGTRLPVYTNAAIYVVVFVSLSLLVGTSGQVSLCHATFLAMGAATFSHLTTGAGLPWLVAFLLAGFVVVPVGALVALPAIRLSGLYLALATFGFAILVERVMFSTGMMFGAFGGRTGARPDVFGLTGDRRFFYLCAFVAAASMLVAAVIRRTRLGRLLRGLADSPVALATNGANANTTRVLVFCISAFLAGLAGALVVSLSGTVNGTAFTSFQNLMFLAVLVIAGRSSLVGSVIAAVLLVVIPGYSTNPNVAPYSQIAFGSVALFATAFGSLISDWITARAPATFDRRAFSPVRARTLAHSTMTDTPEAVDQ